MEMFSATKFADCDHDRAENAPDFSARRFAMAGLQRVARLLRAAPLNTSRSSDVHRFR
jgi:hypothetical protein